MSNFRGQARLHITARACDGHRKQLLLPYPWESDQLEAIRDGVVTVYEAFQYGAPLDLAIAELSAVKAEAEARRQAEALASQFHHGRQFPVLRQWLGLIGGRWLCQGWTGLEWCLGHLCRAPQLDSSGLDDRHGGGLHRSGQLA